MILLTKNITDLINLNASMVICITESIKLEICMEGMKSVNKGSDLPYYIDHTYQGWRHGLVIDGSDKIELFKHNELIKTFISAEIDRVLSGDQYWIKYFNKKSKEKLQGLPQIVDKERQPEYFRILKLETQYRLEIMKIEELEEAIKGHFKPVLMTEEGKEYLEGVYRKEGILNKNDKSFNSKENENSVESFFIFEEEDYEEGKIFVKKLLKKFGMKNTEININETKNYFKKYFKIS